MSDETARPRLIDEIRAKFTRTMRRCDVPELGITLWFPPMTQSSFEQHEALEKEIPSFGLRSLHLLVKQARDEQGAPVFAAGDVEYLRTEVDYAVLQRILRAMYGERDPKLAEAKAALASDPTSRGASDSPASTAGPSSPSAS